MTTELWTILGAIAFRLLETILKVRKLDLVAILKEFFTLS